MMPGCLQQIAFRLFKNHQETFIYGTRSKIDFDAEFIDVCLLDQQCLCVADEMS